MIGIANRVIVVAIEGISAEGRTVCLFTGPFSTWNGKTPSSSKIIFSASAAYRWIRLVPIDIEFEFTFSPPVALKYTQGQIGSNVLASALDPIQNDVVLSRNSYLLPAPLGMEIPRTRWQRIVLQRVIDLVEQGRHNIYVLVFQNKTGASAKRHGEIGIHPSCWHHLYGQGVDSTDLSKTTAEEITQGALNRGSLLIIPVNPKHKITQNISIRITGSIRHCEPKVINDPCTFNISQ